MADYKSASDDYEFSDCLGLALSRDLVQPKFSELLDALEASRSSGSQRRASEARIPTVSETAALEALNHEGGAVSSMMTVSESERPNTSGA